MSCLPEIFTRSTHLQPSKVGGIYSIHLRSPAFTNNPAATASDPYIRNKANRSLDGQRYSKTDSARVSRAKSFFQPRREEGLEEHGHGCDNLNARATQQTEVQAASSFNVLKRNALEQLHLARRSLEQMQSETGVIKAQLGALSLALHSQLDAFHQQCLQQGAVLTKLFRSERRSVIGDCKTIAQQLCFLGEELVTAAQVTGELRLRFEKVTGQFM